MTAPISHGYPDYDRTAAQADVIFINDATSSITNNRVYNSRFVANQKALYASINPNTLGVRMNVGFFADQAATQQIGIYSIDCQPGTIAYQPVPILGPWCKVAVLVAGGGTTNTPVQLFGIPSLGYFSGAQTELAMISQDAVAIGTGVTSDITVTVVQEGECYWYGDSLAGAAGFMQVRAIDYLGNITVLDHREPIAQPQQVHTLWLPPATIIFRIGNTSGAPATYHLMATRRRNS